MVLSKYRRRLDIILRNYGESKSWEYIYGAETYFLWILWATTVKQYKMAYSKFVNKDESYYEYRNGETYETICATNWCHTQIDVWNFEVGHDVVEREAVPCNLRICIRYANTVTAQWVSITQCRNSAM